MKLFSIFDIVKRIKYKPLHPNWIKEPEVSCGMSVVDYRSRNKFQPHFEYYESGSIYYEVIDYNGYIDGEFIDLRSSRRSDVIDMKLDTILDLNKFCIQVNNSLKKLYRRYRDAR